MQALIYEILVEIDQLLSHAERVQQVADKVRLARDIVDGYARTGSMSEADLATLREIRILVDQLRGFIRAWGAALENAERLARDPAND